MNPQALAARGIGLEDVRNVIAQANVDLPKGTLNSPRQTYTLNTNDQLLKPDAYDALIVAYRNGSPVRIRDIGKAIEGPENDLLAGWYNKQRAVILAIQRVPGANVIATVDRVKALLPQLEASLPPAIKVTIAADRTTTIRAAVADVQFTLLLTVALVVMVIFLFLRNLWATVIPAVTVPLSLVGTFAVLYALGYSLDNLSLMALSIAVGFVVDDAVVVIENIVRHLEQGLSPMEAALKGSREIGFTIVSITLSLIAVFIPLFLMGGYVGKLFQEFAVTISVSLLLSLVISLTLTPMMCARLLKNEVHRQHGRLYRLFERGFDGLLALYEHGLKIVLRHRFITLMVMLGTIALTGYLYVVIPKGFFPQQDTGQIVGITEAAEDISFPAMAQRQQALVDILLKDPAIESVSNYIGPGGPTATLNQGRVFIVLKPGNQRDASADQVINRLRPKLAQDPGHHPLHAGGAGHHDRRAPDQDPVPIHADRRRFDRARPLVGDLRREDGEHPRRHRCRQRPGQWRADAQRHRQSRGRLELRHPALDDRQRARRRLRPAHRLDHLHPAQPVSRRARGRSALPVQPAGAERHLPELVGRPAGAAQHAGQQRHQAGADRGQPSGPVPVGHHLVQPAGRAWRWAMRSRPSSRSRSRPASLPRSPPPSRATPRPSRRHSRECRC